MNLTTEKLVRIAESLESGDENTYGAVAAELEAMEPLDIVTVCHFISAWIDPPYTHEMLNNLRRAMGGKARAL